MFEKVIKLKLTIGETSKSKTVMIPASLKTQAIIRNLNLYII